MAPAHEPDPTAAPDALDAPDAALARVVVDDDGADLDLDALAAEVGATRTLLEAIERAGLLVPHHHDDRGIARYAAGDVEAVRAGMVLLDAGLPLGELLDLARRTDTAIRAVATAAVDAFLNYVRDPVRGGSGSEDQAAARLVTAYERMLPATEQLVAHHLRRRLLAEAAERVAAEVASQQGAFGGPDATPGANADRDDDRRASPAVGSPPNNAGDSGDTDDHAEDGEHG